MSVTEEILQMFDTATINSVYFWKDVLGWEHKQKA